MYLKKLSVPYALSKAQSIHVLGSESYRHRQRCPHKDVVPLIKLILIRDVRYSKFVCGVEEHIYEQFIPSPPFCKLKKLADKAESIQKAQKAQSQINLLGS